MNRTDYIFIAFSVPLILLNAILFHYINVLGSYSALKFVAISPAEQYYDWTWITAMYAHTSPFHLLKNYALLSVSWLYLRRETHSIKFYIGIFFVFPLVITLITYGVMSYFMWNYIVVGSSMFTYGLFLYIFSLENYTDSSVETSAKIGVITYLVVYEVITGIKQPSFVIHMSSFLLMACFIWIQNTELYNTHVKTLISTS